MLVVACLFTPKGNHVPRTPVRWLCLRTFTYLSLCHGGRLSPCQWDGLSRLIELGVYLNRCFDGKMNFSPRLYKQSRRDLSLVVTEDIIQKYVRTLKQAEQGRFAARDWPRIRVYRRRVLALSLEALFEVAHLPPRSVLFSLTALIQLVDDVLDRKGDRELGLPTFLCPGSPSARYQADELWRELKAHQHPIDQPVVGFSFLVYLLARIISLGCP